jgi:hypothetical protein
MTSWKLIQKARSILEKERGTVRKPWGDKHSICLIYPNSYHVGMSNLGFQTVYQCLNSENDVVCERTFLPDPEDLQEFRNTRTPLFSLESQKPLSDFDILAFSISFENDFLNILTLLDIAHIPSESHLRKKEYPLVLAGGVAVFLNPEPLSDIFDFFVLGESEEVIREFLGVYRAACSEKGNGRKNDFLRRVSKIEGIYVPGFYRVTYTEDGKIESVTPDTGFSQKVKRRWVKEIDPSSSPERQSLKRWPWWKSIGVVPEGAASVQPVSSMLPSGTEVSPSSKLYQKRVFLKNAGLVLPGQRSQTTLIFSHCVRVSSLKKAEFHSLH